MVHKVTQCRVVIVIIRSFILILRTQQCYIRSRSTLIYHDSNARQMFFRTPSSIYSCLSSVPQSSCLFVVIRINANDHVFVTHLQYHAHHLYAYYIVKLTNTAFCLYTYQSSHSPAYRSMISPVCVCLQSPHAQQIKQSSLLSRCTAHYVVRLIDDDT